MGFDDLDKLIPNTTPSNDGDKSINPNLNNQVKVVADHFLHMINAVVKAEATIFMIITSRSVNSLHKSIRSISSLLGIINVPPLELFESSSVFHTKLRQITGVPLSTETITLARGVEGYTPRDLEFSTIHLSHYHRGYSFMVPLEVGNHVLCPRWQK